jgi:hypothetical protein
MRLRIGDKKWNSGILAPQKVILFVQEEKEEQNYYDRVCRC